MALYPCGLARYFSRLIHVLTNQSGSYNFNFGFYKNSPFFYGNRGVMFSSSGMSAASNVKTEIGAFWRFQLVLLQLESERKNLLD